MAVVQEGEGSWEGEVVKAGEGRQVRPLGSARKSGRTEYPANFRGCALGPRTGSATIRQPGEFGGLCRASLPGATAFWLYIRVYDDECGLRCMLGTTARRGLRSTDGGLLELVGPVDLDFGSPD